MRFSLLIAALAIAVPAAAQAQVKPIKAGATLRAGDATRLGQIDRVNTDGSVQIIFRSKFITVPANTLTINDAGEVTTSLTKREVSKLH